jgi:hypothetical protein
LKAIINGVASSISKCLLLLYRNATIFTLIFCSTTFLSSLTRSSSFFCLLACFRVLFGSAGDGTQGLSVLCH